MTSPETAADPGGRPPRRGRWLIALPTALLLLLAAGWSAFWFVAADRAGDEVGKWIAREADRGRVYGCGKRSVAGYPFRIEIVCDQASARLPADGGPVVANAPRFVAIAQVYDPTRLIGDLTGPVEVTGPDGTRATLTFATAQASAHLAGGRFDRGSVVLKAPRLVVGADEIGAATELQAHLRRAPKGEPGVYDLAARVDKGVSPFLALLPAGEGPVTAELQAEARGLNDLRPQPTSQRLRAFAEAGGRVHVALARIDRGDLAVSARGDLGLDPEGRLDGGFEVAARGVDSLVQGFVGGGRRDALSTLLGAGAAMLGGKAELDGRPASSYRVRIEKGKVALGPIKLGRLPPLF